MHSKDKSLLHSIYYHPFYKMPAIVHIIASQVTRRKPTKKMMYRFPTQLNLYATDMNERISGEIIS